MNARPAIRQPFVYQPAWWQAAFSVMVGLMVLVAVGAWALSTVRDLVKGEKVEFPL